MTAPVLSEVVIVLPEKTERPLRAASPLTKTNGASPLTFLPETVSSPAALPGPANATIEYVASTATHKHIESALRIHSLLFISLLLYRPKSLISKNQTFQAFTRIPSSCQ